MQYRKPDALSFKDAAAFSEIELRDQGSLTELQEKLLQDQLKYLSQHSDFYKKKFHDTEIEFSDITCIKDLKKVPFTVKQDLRDSLAARPPFGEHQATATENIAQMQASSGTTGSPAYVALTEKDITVWQEGTARGLFACGIRPLDKVLHGFSMSKGFVGGLPMFQAVQYMGALDIPVGADGGVDRLLNACRDHRPRAIIGTPNFLLHLAEVSEDLCGCKATDMGVERLIVGGEPGGGIPAIRQALEAAWNAKVCELMGGTDLGVVYWGECDHQQGMHMVAPDYVLTELINPETDEVLDWKAGAVGELVYTSLQREGSPVLRFRSGDHVEVLGTECGCGRTGPLIRCFGRTDDMLIVRGINVFPSAVQDITASMPETNGVMRIYADFDGHTTQSNLKIIVERAEKSDPGEDSALISLITTRLRNALSFKPEIFIVNANSFEKPGVQKVKLTLRECPEFLEIK